MLFINRMIDHFITVSVQRHRVMHYIMWWSGGDQEWCGPVRSDPWQHIAVKGPGGGRANAVVLQSC